MKVTKCPNLCQLTGLHDFFQHCIMFSSVQRNHFMILSKALISSILSSRSLMLFIPTTAMFSQWRVSFTTMYQHHCSPLQFSLIKCYYCRHMIGLLRSSLISAYKHFALSKNTSEKPSSRIAQVQSPTMQTGQQEETGLHCGGFHLLGEHHRGMMTML
jgi:hypothetical protein